MAFSVLDYNKARTLAQQGNVAQAQNILRSAGAPQSAYDTLFPNSSKSGGSSTSGPDSLFTSYQSDPYANMQYGGWYNNPATGSNMRFFGTDASGQPIWTSGSEPSPTQTTQKTDPVQDLIKSAVDAYTKQFNDYTSKLNEYDKNNPFSFDDALAKNTQSVKDRLDPYYQQNLSDFLRGVTTQKSRSIQDTQTLVGDLSKDKDYYTGRSAINLQNTLESTRNNFANNGLYGSGQALRSEGQATEANQADLGNYTRGIDQRIRDAQLASNRLVNEDLPLQTSLFQRQQNQEEGYNVQTQANSQTLQDQRQNAFAKEQYAGTPPGVNPMDYQSKLYGLLTGGSTS